MAEEVASAIITYFIYISGPMHTICKRPLAKIKIRRGVKKTLVSIFYVAELNIWITSVWMVPKLGQLPCDQRPLKIRPHRKKFVVTPQPVMSFSTVFVVVDRLNNGIPTKYVFHGFILEYFSHEKYDEDTQATYKSCIQSRLYHIHRVVCTSFRRGGAALTTNVNYRRVHKASCCSVYVRHRCIYDFQ